MEKIVITIEQVKCGLDKHKLELATGAMIGDGWACALGATILGELDTIPSDGDIWGLAYEKYSTSFVVGFYIAFDGGAVETLGPTCNKEHLNGFQNGLKIRNEAIKLGLLERDA